MEWDTLKRAFKLFDNHGRGALNAADMKNMNRYLGFPHNDEDIKNLMTMIDEDKSGSITFNEFENYVGRVGGSEKLFEERQKRISAKMGAILLYCIICYYIML